VSARVVAISARKVVGALAGVALLAGCTVEPPPQSPVSGYPGVRSERIELGALTADGHCSSPFPLSQLGVRLHTSDGNSYTTPVSVMDGPTSLAPGQLDPSAISWNVNFGQFTTTLVYLPPVDLLPYIGGNLVITAWLTREPNIHAKLVVPPRFDCPQYTYLSGRRGSAGPAAGLGGAGEPGPTVRVSLGYLTGPGQRPLVIARIEDGSGIRARTVFSPATPLQILLDGGPGGMGGPTSEFSVGALSLAHGSAGVGGDGGDGGGAEISFDESAPELERKVIVTSRGGQGGFGQMGSGRPGRAGALPRFTPAPARALFRDELAHGVPIRVPAAGGPTRHESI
jgi:hypothetical protein